MAKTYYDILHYGKNGIFIGGDTAYSIKEMERLSQKNLNKTEIKKIVIRKMKYVKAKDEYSLAGYKKEWEKETIK